MSNQCDLLIANSDLIARAMEYYSKSMRTSEENLPDTVPLFKGNFKNSLMEADFLQKSLSSGAFEDLELSETKIGFISSVLEFYMLELKEDLEEIPSTQKDDADLLDREIEKTENLLQELKFS